MSPVVRSRFAGPTRRSVLSFFPRALRAGWHHGAALLREFRVPLVGFLFLLVVGGLIYGEVYEAVRGDTMPLISRPYMILQLMIMEAPEAVPPEGCS